MQDTEVLNPNICANCSSPGIEPKYVVPLCSPCRDKLSRCAPPIWAKAFAFVVLLAMAISFIQLPASLAIGIAYERGKRAEKAHDYVTAVTHYRKVADKYPNDIDVVARLGIAQFRAGDRLGAIQTLEKLEGKKVDKDLADELDALAGELENPRSRRGVD